MLLWALAVISALGQCTQLDMTSRNSNRCHANRTNVNRYNEQNSTVSSKTTIITTDSTKHCKQQPLAITLAEQSDNNASDVTQ